MKCKTSKNPSAPFSFVLLPGAPAAISEGKDKGYSKGAEWRAEDSWVSKGLLQLPRQLGLVITRLFLWVKKPNFHLLFWVFCCMQPNITCISQVWKRRWQYWVGEVWGVKGHLLYSPCIKGLFCSNHTDCSGFPTHRTPSYLGPLHRLFFWHRTLSPPLFTHPSLPYLSSVFSSSRKLPLTPQIKSDDTVIYPASTSQFSFMVLIMLMTLS